MINKPEKKSQLMTFFSRTCECSGPCGDVVVIKLSVCVFVCEAEDTLKRRQIFFKCLNEAR